jgi:hypothetical protein
MESFRNDSTTVDLLTVWAVATLRLHARLSVSTGINWKAANANGAASGIRNSRSDRNDALAPPSGPILPGFGGRR